MVLRILCLTFLLVIALAGVGVYLFLKYLMKSNEDFYYVDVNSREALFEVDEEFLSVALDVSFMRCLFHKFTDRDWEKLEDLSSLLSPGYLRFGGTDADRLIFYAGSEGGRHVENVSCEDDSSKGNITITGDDWIKFNKFAQKSGLSLIVDLNVLLRKDSQWDSSNAETLIKFSQENGLSLNFQLGNEPNSFHHVFNITINGSQLAEDFHALRRLLNSTEAYQNSKLIGPDVTRPRNENLGSSSLEFLDEFLAKGDVVDVVSWHQYYVNGRVATLEDFVNPDILDVLPLQIKEISQTVRKHSPKIPIWISETSSAYGGGAPKLSNRFAACFMWLDKLGVAAQSGMSVVIRQSLFKDHYALITDNFTPTPDFWISLLYKKLVGRKVLDVKMSEYPSNFLRFYGHCLAENSTVNGSIVIYGMNLSNKTEKIVPSGMSIVYPIYSYIFRAEFQNLQAKTVLLNGTPLIYNKAVADSIVHMAKEVQLPLVVPAHSIGFWVFKEIREEACERRCVQGFPCIF